MAGNFNGRADCDFQQIAPGDRNSAAPIDSPSMQGITTGTCPTPLDPPSHASKDPTIDSALSPTMTMAGSSASIDYEKGATRIATERKLSVDSVDLQSGAPWRPSVFRVGPLVGLAALLFAFLQIFASYTILATSHGDPVKHWRFQPSVYL
jgi:hypothetical protein